MKKEKPSSAKKLIKNINNKKHNKFKSFSNHNSKAIDILLKQYWTPELKPEIDRFMADVLAGREASLNIPAKFSSGLASLLLNNISLWLGNTQEALKHQKAIKNLQSDQ